MRWQTSLFLWTTTILAAGVLAFFVGTAFKAPPKPPESAAPAAPPKQDQPFVTFIDPMKGSPTGKVTIVEFADYNCPFCRAAEDDVQKLIDNHPGLIRYVWKDLPNPNYPGSEEAAEASLCAKDQGKYWEYHQALYQELGGLTEAQLSIIANNLGLDVQLFSQCLSSHQMAPLVERSMSEAQALGIDATPYFFINGQRYSGQLSYDQLETAITTK